MHLIKMSLHAYGLQEAQRAADAGEVPAGSNRPDDQIIGKAHNQTEMLKDPLHMGNARHNPSDSSGWWRLSGATCMSPRSLVDVRRRLVLSRIKRVVWA